MTLVAPASFAVWLLGIAGGAHGAGQYLKVNYPDSTKPGAKHTYAVIAVNSVGLRSEPATSSPLPGIGEAIDAAIDAREISGAVTVVVTKDKVLHLQASGLADIATGKRMQPDSLFWIASMTKPVTAVAVLMLQDEGKLHITDPVAKYIPAFADLKTPSGKPAHLTLSQILTHTSGLGEAPAAEARNARTLADLVPLWRAAPMQYEPGARWRYTQSGINLAARIVEVVSGLSFDVFVQQRILDPLGMKSTTFYPADGSVVTAYAKNRATGVLDPAPPRADFGVRGRPPLGNGGLYSTGPDYARFCQMLLAGGVLDGKRYLSPESIRLLTTVQTGGLPCGFFQSAEFGNHGSNYGWGIGTCILRTPHEGVAAMLSPGTFGHGGAWGTQAWIDPVRGVAYVLMVQRSNFPNSDASGVRRAFQQAAADALAKQSKHSPTTKYPSYDGLVMAGYQGWFRVGRDGRMYPNEARIRIDMWRYRDVIKADMKWCQENSVDYVPCVYPGFSWHNLSRFEFPDDIKPVGSIPRQGGRFYWQLISTAIGAGADKLYVAMFDEVNEGTAIFKCTDHPPVSDMARFIDMDGKPSDHYLWLTGEAGRMLRKESPFSTQMPTRD